MQFPQALASSQYGPISSKTTVAQCDLGPISSNRTIAHDVLDGPICRKTTVAQCDLRPISGNSTVAHAAFYKFYLKQQIKVSWILLFIYTNLGRFSVARRL